MKFICFYRKNGEEMRDEKRTLECLKKGARIASQCLDAGVQVQLYVELLNHYLFYYERGNSLITIAMLNQVIIITYLMKIISNFILRLNFLYFISYFFFYKIS